MCYRTASLGAADETSLMRTRKEKGKRGGLVSMRNSGNGKAEGDEMK